MINIPSIINIYYCFTNIIHLLVISTPLKILVSWDWDDEIPNIWKVIKAMFQTTSQLMLWLYPSLGFTCSHGMEK